MNFFKRYSKRTDEELMALVQQNDTGAFSELYERYSKRILHFMLRMLNQDEEKAQDMLQDLFLKIVERPQLFDTSQKFYTWVFTVATNMCRNHYRNTHPTISTETYELQQPHAEEKLVGELDAALFTRQLEEALNQLEYEQKETFILRYQEGFSLNEIAAAMNCSVGTVKSRIYYTTRKLATELQEFRSLLKK